MSRQAKLFLLIFCIVCRLAQVRAQVIYSNTTLQSAFLATGSPDNPIGTDLTNLNFGGAGTLAVSPASADKGQFQSLLMFNFSGAASLFDSAYGTNGWIITGISLQLTSNYGVAGVQPGDLAPALLAGLAVLPEVQLAVQSPRRLIGDQP